MPALLSLLGAVVIIMILYFGVGGGGKDSSLPGDTPLSGAPGEGYLPTILKAPDRARQVVVPAFLVNDIQAYQMDRGDFPPSLEALEAYLIATKGRGLSKLPANMHYEYDPATGGISIKPGAPPPPPSTDAPPPAGGAPATGPGPMRPGNVRGMLPKSPEPPAE